LGRNEALEAFPVGERLAFDPKRGRLWVVCRACARWSLSPLDERWEAIEAAERRYRDSRLRVSTDNIGLARLREGLDLIRIGEPQRPEMAAWRYGDQFGRRRKRQLLVTGVAVGAVASVIGGVMAAGASAGAFGGVWGNAQLWSALIHGRPGQVVARLVGPEGEPLVVERRHARMSRLLKADADFGFWLEHTRGRLFLRGDHAARAAQRILPTVNRFGGSARQVQQAVRVLEEAGSPEAVLRAIQARRGAVKAVAQELPWGYGSETVKVSGNKLGIETEPGALHWLPVEERLALEMALHEESERRAMEGELAALEAAWREAEEIAQIADDMFTPAVIEARLAALRGRGRGTGAPTEGTDDLGRRTGDEGSGTGTD
jgi:hypothetical protein